MIRFTVLYFAIIYSVHVLCEDLNQTQFCSQDLSETMFLASTVVLAKVKTIKTRGAVSLLDIRISKVIKTDPGYPIKKKKKLKVHHSAKFCKPIKVKKKYIFSLSYTGGYWSTECRPVTASKKIKKMMQNLFCTKCGKGPTVKAISNTATVKINR